MHFIRISLKQRQQFKKETEQTNVSQETTIE